MKILIVDDDPTKIKNIINKLEEVEGFNLESVSSETNAHSAKLRLEKTSFDLMILDIALPNRINKGAERDGGIKLLDAILENDERLKMPAHIIAITAYSDIKQEFEEKFSQSSISILIYDSVYDDWKRPLQAKFSQIIASSAAKQSSVPDYNSFLCIVCALDSELNSVLDLDWSWKLLIKENDNSLYYKGELIHDGVKKLVYAAAASRMGMTASAILSMKMVQTFQPEYLAMTGIAAGTPGKTKFGDVIVADPSWDYGSGKILTTDGKLSFLPAPHHIPLSPTLKTKFKLLREDRETLTKIKYGWKDNKPDNEISILIGPLASGASVIADGSTIDRVKLQHKELLGIEMESYSTYAVAEETPDPKPKVFSMKSVVDFGNDEKDDRFQRYGSYTSAQVLKVFVEKYL